MLAVFLATPAVRARAESPVVGALMFLAARPTPKGPATFPATVFGIEPLSRRLIILQEIIPASEGVDFVRSNKGVLSIGSPNIFPRQIKVVGRRLQSIGTSSVPLANDVFYYTNVSVSKEDGSLLELMTSGTLGPSSVEKNIAVALNPAAGVPHVLSKPELTHFSHLDIEGQTGGSDENWDGFKTEITQAGTGSLAWPGMPKTLAPAPDGLLGTDKTATISVVAANTGFLLILQDRDGSFVDRARESIFYLFDFDHRKWSRLPLAGSLTRVRLFGSCLSAITVLGAEAPGSNDPALKSHSGLDWMNPGAIFPGELTIINLKTGERSKIETGEADSEILSIDGPDVLYRVNDQLLTGKIKGGTVTGQSVIAKDERVRDIHWML